MIEFEKERILSFCQAARVVAHARGGSVHVSSLYRWAGKGLKGVRLEWIQVGGRRCTSHEALGRFIRAISSPCSQATTTETHLQRPKRDRDRILNSAKLI